MMDLQKFLLSQKTFFTHLEPTSLFEAILAFMPELGAEFGSILLHLQDQTVHFQSTLPGQEDLVGPVGRRFGLKLLADGLEGAILNSRQAEVIDDVLTDPRWYHAAYVIQTCRAAVIIPLQLPKVQGSGIILLGNSHPGAFPHADLPVLQIIVEQWGYAIENTLLYRTQLDHTTQLHLINQVSRAATSILNVNVMITTVLQAIQRSFTIYRVAIYQLTSQRNTLKMNEVTNLHQRSRQAEEILLTSVPLINQALTSEQPIVQNDLKTDATADNPNVKSRLIIPVKLGAKPVGALELESVRLDAFDPALSSALETLGDQLAVAIENARLYDELNDTINELVSLNRITQSVSATLDFQQTLTLITEHVTAMLNVAATSIALRDDTAGNIWFAAASGEGSTAVVGKRLPVGQGIIGWVAEKGKPIIIHDVQQDSRFFSSMDQQSGFKTRSILCVPLQTKGKLIGAIEAMNKLDGAFTHHDLIRLTDLTAPAATAIENAQLYQELAQRMQQLEQTQTQLIQSAKLSAIGELAAGVAHEINNPLTSIIGLTKLWLQDITDHPAAEDMKIVVEEAQRAKHIVRSLLDFARIDKPDTAPLNLNQIIEGTLFLLFTETVRHKIKLTKNLAELPPVPVDSNQIKQVFVNIIQNAIQAMPNGGELTVVSHLSTDQRAVIIRITDTGGGIPAHYLEKVFEPFFTTKEVGQGTGLGLAVSYGIIERHNGSITIENNPGTGVTIQITLPVRPPHPL